MSEPKPMPEDRITVVPAAVRTTFGCPQLEDKIDGRHVYAIYEEWVHALIAFYLNRALTRTEQPAGPARRIVNHRGDLQRAVKDIRQAGTLDAAMNIAAALVRKDGP